MPLAPGEVSRLVVTERELQQQVFPTVWSNFFFQAKKKEAKKSLATTTATVYQAPQRFQVREKTNACYFTVGTDVLGCPIVVLRKSKRDSINRIISLCYELLTSFVGRVARRVKRIVRWTIRSQSGEQFIIATGNCSRRHSIRTVGDACPYNFETSVLAQTNDL